jgi:hypothetical protein
VVFWANILDDFFLMKVNGMKFGSGDWILVGVLLGILVFELSLFFKEFNNGFIQFVACKPALRYFSTIILWSCYKKSKLKISKTLIYEIF